MIDALLAVAGIALIALGLAHAALPRALGWTAVTHTDAGPLSAVVVRLHVVFVGAFLVLLGVLTVLVGLGPPTPLGRVLCVGAAIIFGARAVAEIVVVGGAVSGRVRVLHRLALVAWPALAVLYAVAAYTT